MLELCIGCEWLGSLGCTRPNGCIKPTVVASTSTEPLKLTDRERLTRIIDDWDAWSTEGLVDDLIAGGVTFRKETT